MNNNNNNNNKSVGNDNNLINVIDEIENSRKYPTSVTVHFPVLTIHCLDCSKVNYIPDKKARVLFAKGKLELKCVNCQRTLRVEAKNEEWNIHPTFLNLDTMHLVYCSDDNSDVDVAYHPYEKEPTVYWKDDIRSPDEKIAKVSLTQSSANVPQVIDLTEPEPEGPTEEQTLADIEESLRHLEALNKELDDHLKTRKEFSQIQRKMLRHLKNRQERRKIIKK